MAGEWINRKARDMCDCSRCQPDGSLSECMRGTYESGIRAGLKHAAELARQNDACMVCSCVLQPETHACGDGCASDYDETEHGEPVATADLIERLLTPGASRGR